MSPVRSKILRNRAKASARRIATRVIVDTLADTKSRKLVDAVASTAAVQEAGKGATERPWLVMTDSQGVAYLRVEILPKGGRFLLNTGRSIEVVELPNDTIRSRNLKAAPEASVLDAAKILARPLTSSVTIAARSRPYLNLILNDEELITMAKAKKTTKKAAGKTAKGKTTSNGTSKRGPRVNDAASIEKKYTENPYRAGSARATLLDLAAKSKTVGKFYEAAGKPSGGSASAYLGVFVKAGHLKVSA